ncbi:helix-turn-helix domain-containing protein [Halorussus marinus]|uniref:helix-turn-helix domain-containing protein n=1 Tax=Halorussus marinus TaxID=2505976 RepID=UPI001FD69A7A|nr:helix-turn-helix domain-containing protein [Halorussus marinus]
MFTDYEPRTAKEVAEELEIVRRTAYNKLEKLEERGDLKKKKVGWRAVVWWKP